MKILVCVKQIPDTNDVRWSADNNLIRQGVISILNPCDISALNEVKKIKNADVTILSMGPIQSIEAIRYALCFAGNRGILLSDKKFAAADTLATAKTLYFAIKNYIKEFDLIVTGQWAQDGDTAQTPYSLANLLNIPNIGYVSEIEEINQNETVVTSKKDNGIYKIKGKFPLLISICNDKTPYTPLVGDYIRAQDTEIKILNAENICAPLDEIGIKGSPTYVSKAFRPKNNRCCNFIQKEEFIEDFEKWKF